MMTLVYVLATADRQILSLLVEPIKNDLNISDTQFGLIGGFAFAFLYALLGIPLGYLADNISRKKIISFSLLVWSTMTALCGTAGNFLQLFLYRVGVGAGEAGLGPAANSVISDLFPPQKRGLPMGLFLSGTCLGTGMALLGGGALINYLNGLESMSLPVLGIVEPWQVVFFFFAPPGIIVAVLLLLGAEPKRQPSSESSSPASEGSQWNNALDVLPYIGRRWRLYLALIGCFSMSGMMMHSVLLWMPSFFIRSFGWSLEQTGTSLGLIIMIFGTVGTLGGGYLLNLLEKRRVDVAAVKLAAVVLLAVTVSAEALFLMPPFAGTLLLVGITVGGLWLIGPVMLTALIAVTEGEYIGRVSALTLLGINLIGMGFGPVLVALATDHVFGDEAMVGYSLAIVVLFAGIVGIALLLRRHQAIPESNNAVERVPYSFRNAISGSP